MSPRSAVHILKSLTLSVIQSAKLIWICQELPPPPPADTSPTSKLRSDEIRTTFQRILRSFIWNIASALQTESQLKIVVKSCHQLATVSSSDLYLDFSFNQYFIFRIGIYFDFIKNFNQINSWRFLDKKFAPMSARFLSTLRFSLAWVSGSGFLLISGASLFLVWFFWNGSLFICCDLRFWLNLASYLYRSVSVLYQISVDWVDSNYSSIKHWYNELGHHSLKYDSRNWDDISGTEVYSSVVTWSIGSLWR